MSLNWYQDEKIGNTDLYMADTGTVYVSVVKTIDCPGWRILAWRGALEDFKSIAAQSTGYLEAVLVWEGGDSLEWLKIHDGKVTTGPITADMLRKVTP